MTDTYKYSTEYFLQEGKDNLARCLEATFEAAIAHNIGKIVIFTSAGKGVRMAVDGYCSNEKFAHIKVIAVTFASQTKFTKGDPSEHFISNETADFLASQNVPIVRAHLPFDPIRAHHDSDGILGQDFGLISNALRIFCGSMSLCVQAVLMASDAGHVDFGEHVIAMTSDTSILARAATTNRFLTDLIVREILCKPVLLNIGKGEKIDSYSGTSLENKSPVTLDLTADTSDSEARDEWERAAD